MNWLFVFNLAMIAVVAAILAGWIPRRLYNNLLRGLHFTIGITTPTERQVRWVLVVWLISIVVIVDAVILVFKYV